MILGLKIYILKKLHKILKKFILIKFHNYKTDLNNISKFVKYCYINVIILCNIIFEYIYFSDDI